MTTGLPTPLIDKEVDLRDFRFMPLDIVKLMNSETWALASGNEAKACINLWCKAWHQVPAGSLPNNEHLLAIWSGIPDWEACSDIALRGFIQCSDGRLYHPVICEKAMEAWGRVDNPKRQGVAGAQAKWGQPNTAGRTRSARLAEARRKGSHTKKEWEALVDILGNRCVVCGVSSDEERLCKDHIVPIYQGGSDACKNVQPMCAKCNSRKGADITDYRIEICPDWEKRLHERLHTSETPAKRLAIEKDKDKGKRNTKRKASLDAEFEIWWEHVPHKLSRGRAERAYRSARKLTDAETLLDAIKAYAEQTADRERQYVKHPATWLNGKCWLDEPDEDPPPDGGNGGHVPTVARDRGHISEDNIAKELELYHRGIFRRDELHPDTEAQLAAQEAEERPDGQT